MHTAAMSLVKKEKVCPKTYETHIRPWVSVRRSTRAKMTASFSQELNLARRLFD